MVLNVTFLHSMQIHWPPTLLLLPHLYIIFFFQTQPYLVILVYLLSCFRSTFMAPQMTFHPILTLLISTTCLSTGSVVDQQLRVQLCQLVQSLLQTLPDWYLLTLIGTCSIWFLLFHMPKNLIKLFQGTSLTLWTFKYISIIHLPEFS